VITYPNLVAALDGIDLVDLALVSGVPVHIIVALRDGGYAASFGIRYRLARALRASPAMLFRPHSDVGNVDIDLTPIIDLAGYVTDAEALRIVDRPPGDAA